MASFGTFLRYSLLQILQNSRRTFSAAVGIILAVTLVSAELISVDSTARASLDSVLRDTPVDIVARTTSTSDYTSVASALSGAGGVERVEPISAYQLAVLAQAPRDGAPVFTVRISGVTAGFASVAARFGFSGKLSLPAGGIAISQNLSDQTGVRLGQTLRLVLQVEAGWNSTAQRMDYRNNTVELQVASVLSESGVPRYYDFPQSSDVSFSPSGNQVIFTETGELGRYFIRDLAAFVPLDGLGELAYKLFNGSVRYTPGIEDQEFNRTFHYCVWVDRSALINPYDVEGSRAALQNVGSRLFILGDLYGVEVDNALPQVLQKISQAASRSQQDYITYSLPVVFLGLYLGILGVDLGMSERRREMALLKSRGAGRSHLLRMFVTESVLLGIIAGVAGLALGAAVSELLFRYLMPSAEAGFELFVTPPSATLAVVLAVFLMMAAMYRPAQRGSRLEISEGLQYYSTEEAVERYNPRNAALMTAVSVFFYLLMVLFDPQQWIADGRSLSNTFALLDGLRSFGTLISPLIVLMFVFGVAGLLTRASYRPYGVLSRISRPLTGELWPVVHRNLTRNPRRASRVCVIIALALTFGMLVTTSAGSELEHQQRLSRTVVGGDLRVELAKGASGTSPAGELAGLPHVKAVTPALRTDGSIGPTNLDVWVLNSSAYARIARPDGFLFLSGSPADVPGLAGGKRMIINHALQVQTAALPGDELTVSISPGQGLSSIRLTCRITAVVKAMPGTLDVQYGLVLPANPAIYIDEGNLPQSLIAPRKSIYIVSSGSPHEAEKEIKTAFISTGRLGPVLLEQDFAGQLQSGTVSLATYRFLLLESGFTVVIITIGLALILLAAMLERQNETAGWRARGATRAQVASLFIAEAVTLLALALAVGLVTGFLTAYMAAGMLASSADPIGRTFVVPADTFLLVGAMAGALLATSCLVAWKAGRAPMGQVLRLRGG
jgi:putative ABC transport system permease protein